MNGTRYRQLAAEFAAATRDGDVPRAVKVRAELVELERAGGIGSPEAMRGGGG